MTPTPHDARIQRQTDPQRGHVHRLVCKCGVTSPWTYDRQTAELARDNHIWELG